jgi:rubredoxin
MNTCEICGWTWDGDRGCRRCLTRSGTFEPTPTEIRAACEQIQAGWTRAVERSRRQISNPVAEVPRAHMATDHMVRREGDKT